MRKGDACFLVLVALSLLSLPYLVRVPMGAMASWYEMAVRYLVLPSIVVVGFVGSKMYLTALTEDSRGARIKASVALAVILMYVVLKVAIF